jgi:hypothetical protein
MAPDSRGQSTQVDGPEEHIIGCAAHAQLRTFRLAKGDECRESALPYVSGEKHSLDIPFYRTCPKSDDTVSFRSGQDILARTTSPSDQAESLPWGCDREPRSQDRGRQGCFRQDDLLRSRD